eukprot:TRINITY_DN8010_c0_g1_i1.p1 TRINITY_DN8010_c0_g1~~TRINITY_DN8010_c0_g1_i1.p1  ORF type:complete len:470 (+),score=93.67 TRINITY_DN8010_c0_g1_i1:90-1499(+)
MEDMFQSWFVMLCSVHPGASVHPILFSPPQASEQSIVHRIGSETLPKPIQEPSILPAHASLRIEWERSSNDDSGEDDLGGIHVYLIPVGKCWVNGISCSEGKESEKSEKIEGEERELDVVEISHGDIIQFGTRTSKASFVVCIPRKARSRGIMFSPKREKRAQQETKDLIRCSICANVFDDPVMITGCGHTFCHHCLAKWVRCYGNMACPMCRCKCERIRPNATIASIAMNFLSQPSPDGFEMGVEDGPDEGGKRDGEEDKEWSFTHEELAGALLFAPGERRASHVRCRWCDGRNPVFDGESRCRDKRHGFCAGCGEAMPQVPGDEESQCPKCQRFFCGIIFEKGGGCPDGMMRLEDQSPPDLIPHDAFSGNSVEMQIFRDYMMAKGLSVAQLWSEYVAQNPRKLLCRSCTLRHFGEWIFQYRVSIPASELPDTVTCRPDCWHGKTCWTQRKRSHAEKYNHACEEKPRK